MNHVHEKEAENQFQRLPNDVVVIIFDKVSDIKWLCRCFVVSKRFSSLVPRVRTLSIQTNAWDYLSIPRSDFEKLAVLPSLNDSGFEFLAKLTQVRSLNLDLVSDFIANNDSVFKWGAKITPNLDSVTFLYAASLTKMMDSEEEETENEITQEELARALSLAIECIGEAILWLGILSLDIPKHPMLESITITDSMNKGVRLCLGGEKLVECRNAFRIAVERLKEAAYVMKRVTIVQFRLYSGDDSEANLAMVDAFAEEQGVFSEAVVQILKNHKDNALRSPRGEFLLGLGLNQFDVMSLIKKEKSLNLDLVSDFNADNDSVFKWGAKFTSNLDSLTFLCASSLSEKRMESEQEEEETENEITNYEHAYRVNLAIQCLKEALLWLETLSHVIHKNPMLESITITDSNNKGVKLCLGGEKLVGMCSMISSKRAEAWTPENTRVGYFPVLQLPGYVMKGYLMISTKCDFLALDDQPTDNDELGFGKFNETAVGSTYICRNFC
ncbi:hypothetical protein RHGRI_038005 [Rhododendron griersonianum]|uniref:F-box domain-containing protein n=1 Tax=Rhododendron griersonianum TaxID=479676 RepID=A0AAV6HX56_9ERIC|nr:hypothetical protein RHGRI_038005 [Rhododendron griersonianum]